MDSARWILAGTMQHGGFGHVSTSDLPNVRAAAQAHRDAVLRALAARLLALEAVREVVALALERRVLHLGGSVTEQNSAMKKQSHAISMHFSLENIMIFVPH